MAESLYWADQIARRVVKEFPNEKIYTVAAGITPSGTIHIGNFREIITVDIICRALKDLNKNVRFIYSWDDYDRIRKIPKNIPNRKQFEKYLYTPGINAPDPWKCHKSYVEHFEKEIEETLPLVGINPKFIHQAEMYLARKYADSIKLALEQLPKIKSVLNKYRKEPLPKDWYPISIYCEKCNKEQVNILDWDKKYTLKYQCKACGFDGELNFKKKGNVKLLWRVDWPMRWAYEKVNCEGGGKEHSTPGGSYDTAKEIVKIFGWKAPIYFMYDFVIIKGAGGKMSSSLGNVITLKDALEIYLPEIVRYMFAGRKPKTEFAISFDEDVLKIYEDFYECERIYFGKKKVSEKEQAHWSRVYEMSCVSKPLKKMPVQPAVRTCIEYINIYQNPKKATEQYCSQFKVSGKASKTRVFEVMKRAQVWLEKYAPEKYKFELQKHPNVKKFSDNQKKALLDLADALEKPYSEPKELAQIFGKIAQKNNLEISTFFKIVYTALIGKERGPRLAPFILSVGQKTIKQILNKYK